MPPLVALEFIFYLSVAVGDRAHMLGIHAGMPLEHCPCYYDVRSVLPWPSAQMHLSPVPVEWLLGILWISLNCVDFLLTQLNYSLNRVCRQGHLQTVVSLERLRVAALCCVLCAVCWGCAVCCILFVVCCVLVAGFCVVLCHTQPLKLCCMLCAACCVLSAPVCYLLSCVLCVLHAVMCCQSLLPAASLLPAVCHRVCCVVCMLCAVSCVSAIMCVLCGAAVCCVLQPWML